MGTRCFVTIFDDQYYEYGAVLLQSLADNYKKELDVICIVNHQIIKDREGKMPSNLVEALTGADHLNIMFRVPENSDAIMGSTNRGEKFPEYISEVALHKLNLASICHDYEEAVFVDADCLFVRDATKLIEHPLYRPIVALPETSLVAERDLGMPERAYFNNGVFVTDLDFWRSNEIEAKFLDWLRDNDSGLAIEQTTMNAVLFEHWFPMTNNFNYWDGFTWALHRSYPNPVLVHFLGHIKPWTDNHDYDPERGPHDVVWRRVYNRVWGIENFWRKDLD